jgi:hypothetical protein
VELAFFLLASVEIWRAQAQMNRFFRSKLNDLGASLAFAAAAQQNPISRGANPCGLASPEQSLKLKAERQITTGRRLEKADARGCF